MRKYLLALLFLPSIALATDTNNLTVTGRVITQRMDVSTMGKVVQIGFVDGSSQTTAGFVRFKDEGIYFMSGSTIDCVGTAITCSDAGNGVTQINVSASGGGGGGGGGGGAIFTGSVSVGYSTQSFPGATITSDGNGFSTVTYMPAINSTFTLLSNSTATLFLNLTSTGVSLSRLWTVTVSTWNAFTAFTSTTQAFTESAIATMTAIRTSTATFESRFNLFSSTVQSFSESTNSTMTAIRQSTATFEARFNNFASTVTAQDEIFKGWFSSNSAINDLQNSSGTALAQTVSQRTLVGYDEGGALSGGNVTAINWVGAAVTATQLGSTITATVTASGGSGGPTPSIAIGTGTTRGSSIISSNTVATVIFSDQNFKTQLVDATTTFITLSTAPKTFSLIASFDGGGSAITASSSSVVIIPFESNITSFTILSPIQAGEARARVMSASFANFPTFTNVCSANCPSLSGATQKVTDSTLTGWTTNVNGGDIFMVSVDTAATSITNLTVQINMVRR